MLLVLSVLIEVEPITTAVTNSLRVTCQPGNHKTVVDEKLMKQLEPLKGKSYPVDDGHEFSYTIGICKEVDTVGHPNAGVTQYSKEKKNITVVGLISEAQIKGGTNWLMLEYKGGSPYPHSCNREKRQATLMFVCDPTKTDPNQPGLRIVEENKDKTKDCYYLFEIGTNAVCTKSPFVTFGLSAGSIFCIICFTLLGVYLIGGFLYQRFVIGAKGFEQIPNYEFWQDFGNLQSDGCNLICRSGSRQSARSYKGIGDDQLGTVEDELDDRDDHLLPM
ncbi:unnamed protein product [Owenia fusiformis]|uniref:MRH domain-containing protein n=1 Tax=Owenia fusiformis TaxID=6347 RepID=A0A8S4N1K0_OWEFU|nr:unnamed protein product [Owenia fusiformis]